MGRTILTATRSARIWRRRTTSIFSLSGWTWMWMGRRPIASIEMNSVPVPTGPANPYGGAFQMQETELRTESEAQRNLDLATSRKWIVTNPSARNALGHPTGYALLPGENAVLFAQPDSWVRKRAAFLNSHVWVTPYQAGEIYAGGDYPNQSRGGDGLPRWAAANRTHSQPGRGLVVHAWESRTIRARRTGP